jgi:uncharacterized protein (DUF1778 family)
VSLPLLSQPFSYNPSLTTLLSQPFSHNPSLTTLLSQPISHNPSLTTLLSQPFSHNPSLTTLLSQPFSHNPPLSHDSFLLPVFSLSLTPSLRGLRWSSATRPIPAAQYSLAKEQNSACSRRRKPVTQVTGALVPLTGEDRAVWIAAARVHISPSHVGSPCLAASI